MRPFSEVEVLCGGGNPAAMRRQGRLCEEGSEGSLSHSHAL